MVDRGLEPDLEKGCNSCLIRAEPIPLTPGVPYPNMINRTNGSFYRNSSLVHIAVPPSQAPVYYPHTANIGFFRTYGYFNEPDGKDCITKMKMPAAYAMATSMGVEFIKTLLGDVSCITKFFPIFPRVAFATALGASAGLTTCMLSNVKFLPEDNKFLTYFPGGFLGGFLWQMSRGYNWSLGRGTRIGSICGIVWYGINKSWYASSGGFFSIDPQADSNWHVNHLPRANTQTECS